MSWGRLEEGTHLDHLVRTSHCLLLVDLLGKAHLGTAQEELPGKRKTVQLGRGLGLQEAVLELLQMDTARETAQGLQDWRGTALELLVDTVLVSQDQGGSHQGLKVALGIALVLQDQSEMETALEPRGQMIHQQSQPEQRAGWVPLGLSQAILGL